MKNSSDFAKSLRFICKSWDLSLSEFSKMLDVSKATLKNIMDGSNTSLFTALRIAKKLNLPLSILTGEVITVEDIDSLKILVKYFGWMRPIAEADDGAVYEHARTIMRVVQRRPSTPAQDEQTAS